MKKLRVMKQVLKRTRVDRPLLPLLFGGSIGPEAGLTGVIVGLCCWAGDHMRFLRGQMAKVPEMGISAALGVIFGAPLFGLAVPIEETSDTDRETVLPKAAKLFLTNVCIQSGWRGGLPGQPGPPGKAGENGGKNIDTTGEASVASPVVSIERVLMDANPMIQAGRSSRSRVTWRVATSTVTW